LLYADYFDVIIVASIGFMPMWRDKRENWSVIRLGPKAKVLSTCNNKYIYIIFYLDSTHSQHSVFSSYIFESTTIIDRDITIKIAVDDGVKIKG
jgi:hypothetical protein